MKFELDDAQQTKLKEWVKEQDAKVIAKNRSSKNGFAAQMAEDGMAYYGAIDGGYEYCFIPTGLGVIASVKNILTKEEINLTDYESW